MELEAEAFLSAHERRPYGEMPVFKSLRRREAGLEAPAVFRSIDEAGLKARVHVYPPS